MEASFHEFLDSYVQQIKQRNVDYLVSVHPDLPEDMREFFFDITQDMMKYADEQAAVSGESARRTFERIHAAALEMSGAARPVAPTHHPPARASVAAPRLTEPWFC